MEISGSLINKMTKLRSVTKIVCLVDELNDIPSKQQHLQKYFDENILKINNKLKLKYEIAYKCWKYSCCNHKLYINNPSIPIKTRNRFQKEIDKINNKKISNNQQNEDQDKDENTFKVNRNKLHGLDINFANPVYRSHCDRKGSHEWNSLFIEKEIAGPIHDILGFEVNLKFYDIELFSYCRQNIMLYGISVISDLHVRNRISTQYSTILNNCICFLVGKMANICDNMVVMDPMCGLGSTIIECKMAFHNLRNVKYIGSDIELKAIKQAKKNAKYCGIQVNENGDDDDGDGDNIDFKQCDMMEFHNWDIVKLSDNEIKDECVDIMISDLPFGHKCGTHKTNRKLYPLMLESMNRILKLNGKALLITMERKLLIKLLDTNDKQWKYDTIEIDVGGFDALLFIITKIGKYQDEPSAKEEEENHECIKHKVKKSNDDNDYEATSTMSLDSQ